MTTPPINPREYPSRRMEEYLEVKRYCVEQDRRVLDDIESYKDALAAQAALGPFSTWLTAIATVCLNDPNADFWLQRRGNEDRVGRPMTGYNLVAGRIEEIGICVTRPDIVSPVYLRFWFEMLWRKGYWRIHSKGTLVLQHITVRDVKKLVVTFRP